MKSEDIFAEWKTSRFIIAPGYLTDGIFSDDEEHLVILSDFNYWVDHSSELSAWCKQHNCRLEGMTVIIPNNQTLTLFSLRWS